MSMANREKSDPAQHETFPGPGPSKSSHNLGGRPPVEQMVDAAIDRLAREYAAGGRDLTPALERVPKASGLAAPAAEGRLLTDGRSSSGKRTGKLRWKGLDVSDEFRQYAERVARGEDLPPYEGKILAEPDAAFPWEPAARRSASRRARTLHGVLWAGAVVVGGLALWMVWVQVGARGAKGSGAVASDSMEQAILSSRAFPSEVDSSEVAARPASDGSQVGSEIAPALGTPGPTDEVSTQPTNRGELTAKVEVSAVASRSPEAPSPTAPAARAAIASTPQRAESHGVAAGAPGGFSGQVATPAPRPSSTAGFGAAVQPVAASPVSAAAASVPSNDASSGNGAAPAGTVAGAKPARKEPAPAPSGMGSLLVETPSF